MKSLQLQEVDIAGGKILGDVDEHVKLFHDIDKQVKVSDATEEQVHHSGDFDKQVHHSGQEVEEVHHSGDVDEQRQMWDASDENRRIWDAVDEQRKLKKLEEKRKKQQQRRQKKKKLELEVGRKELEKRRKKSTEICELKMKRGGGSPFATHLSQRVTRSPFVRSPALNMLRYSLGVLAKVTSSKRGRSASMRAESSPLYKRAKPSMRPPSVPRSPSLISSLVGGSSKVSHDSGYPKLSMTGNTDGMILVNTFEETFGDQHGSGKGVWSEFGTEVSTNLRRTVVSLASFSGETRSFACTGLFIEWNGCTTILTSASFVRNPDDKTEIVANMKIEVLLPDNQCREGILQHCNLRYNVALVSVKGYRALHSANILQRQDQHSRDLSVVAIGRCFKSGILMATCGKLVPWSGNFGNSLEYSTCKITKAGIGGPVVDFDGNFVGMNFYDKKMGTPYLSGNTILKALAPFKNKRIVVEADSDVNPKRWPVPSPWCQRKSVSELRDNGAEDDNRKYRYVNGVKLMYSVSVKLYSPPLLIVGNPFEY